MTEESKVTLDGLGATETLTDTSLLLVRKGQEDFKIEASDLEAFIVGGVYYDNVSALIADIDVLVVGKKYLTLGYTSKGDGGGNIYEVKTSDSRPSADGGKYIHFPTSAVLYLEGIFVSGKYSAKQWGAVGDGSTDDTSIFSNIEINYSGEAIDLLGETCKVDAIPSGCDYHNGYFKVSSDIYPLHKSASSHPFERPSSNIRAIRPTKRYDGLNKAYWHIPGTSRQIILYRDAEGHGDQNGTDVLAIYSDDFWQKTKEAPESIYEATPAFVYSDASYDTRNCCSGVMGSGRIGSVWSRSNEANSYTDMVFIYSDNPEAADTSDIVWNTSTIPFTTTSADCHGDIIAYPASVGGSDSAGFVFYTYSSGADGISAYYTTNNGSSWTEAKSIVTANVAVPSVSEISVTRIGDQDKWVMAIRYSGGNLAMSVSANPISGWSEPVLTTLPAGGTAPYVFYDAGKLWAVGFSRRNDEIIDEYGNAMLISEGDIDSVYSSGGASGWSGWRMAAALPHWATGYINVQKVRNRWYGVFTAAEDTSGSTTSRRCDLYLISCDPSPTLGVDDVYRMIPNNNLWPCGDLRRWPIGTSIAAAGSRVSVMPGLTFARDSFTTGATITRQTGERAQYKMRVRRDDSDSSTASLTLVHTMTLDDTVNNILKRSRFVTISFRARAASGFSAADNFLRVRMRGSDHGTEQQVTNAGGTFTTSDNTIQSANTGVYLSQNWEDFNVTIGPVDETYSQVLVQFQFTPVGTASNDYYEIENIKIEEGKTATPLIPDSYGRADTYANRFLRRYTTKTENATVVREFHPPMHRAPTVTTSVGSITGTPGAANYRLTHTSVADTVITSDANL